MQLQTQPATNAGNHEALPKVRLAKPADAQSLFEIGCSLHEENGLMPISKERCWQAVVRAINKDRMIAGVIGPVGKLEAAIILTIGQFWYTDYPHLEELAAYVLPAYRRSNRAKALVEFAKNSASELKVPLLIGIISNNRTEAKIRLYERQLGPRSGAFYLWNGKTGA